MTPTEAVAQLEASGFRVQSDELQLEQRGPFWVGKLHSPPAIAWFPSSTKAAEMLARERRVLEVVAAHCSFEVPRPLFVNADTGMEVRTAVDGLADHRRVFERVRADSEISRSRVLLDNAVRAISYLSYRVGTSPDDAPGGRTLIQDVCWTRNAVAAVLG